MSRKAPGPRARKLVLLRLRRPQPGHLRTDGGQFGVPAKYEIKDGHLLTTLGGTPFEATVFEQNGKYVAARSNEFGYVNYEVEAVK